MSTNYPTHPIYAWRPTITGSVTWDDGTDSAAIDLSATIGSAYWGWYSDGSNVATAASIQGRLAALIQAGLVAAGSAGSALIASYTWPSGDSAPPITSYALSHGTANVGLTFTNAATAAQFGVEGTTTTLEYSTANAVDFTDAGHWQPSCTGGYDERWPENPNVGITSTIDGSTVRQRTWGTTLDRRTLAHPTVLVSNIRTDAATETSQVAAAQRNVADPNSLLANLVEAARLPESTDVARTFRIFTAAGVNRACQFVDPAQITDLLALCSSVSVRRIWGVSLVLRDNG